jgi:hypothetical protein
VSDTIDQARVKELFPSFKIPKPGEPATLFFRLDNASTSVVSMSPSKNESFSDQLVKSSFANGPYRYTGRIAAKQTGDFSINGIVVAFFAPVAGAPLDPPGGR